MSQEGKIGLVLSRSPIGGTQRQRETVRALGLRRIGQRVEVIRTPATEGMIDKVRHLLTIEGEQRA